jgi:hypothetical protein
MKEQMRCLKCDVRGRTGGRSRREIPIAVRLQWFRTIWVEKQAFRLIYRFRDKFAVELLLAGVPVERVSILLGPRSIRITEKHYAPWVRAPRKQAEGDVRRAWAQDPLALLESKGTPEVHRKTTAVN